VGYKLGKWAVLSPRKNKEQKEEECADGAAGAQAQYGVG
jgi:hypothetical protein